MSLARWIATLLVVVAPVGAIAQRSSPSQRPSAAPRVARDVSGAYESNWDEVRLTQRGSIVMGSYICCGGGTIEGRIIEGRTLHYHWKQPGAEGSGVWTIEGTDRLEGTWGIGDDDAGGGRWDLVRARQIAR